MSEWFGEPTGGWPTCEDIRVDTTGRTVTTHGWSASVPEIFDQQLARLREMAASQHRFGGCAPDDFYTEKDAAALAELLRRWDVQTLLVSELERQIDAATSRLRA